MMKSLLIASLLLCSQAQFNVLSADDYDDDDLPYVSIITAKNFSKLSAIAESTNQIIMLEVAASYCGYCELLEEEIIKPMLRSNDYTNKVLIRQLEMDSHYTIIDFAGEKNSPDQLAKKFHVQITPTLLFLDSDGNEVAERILGINSLDFFGGYVDDAINEGLRSVRKSQ